MPAKNVSKVFISSKIYHLYNRGVDKRIIFSDDQDYRIFLTYLKYYLSPDYVGTTSVFSSETDLMHRSDLRNRLRPTEANLSQEVELLTFNLMPNHFHLQLYQKTINGMTKLMRRICTGYSLYFNRRHKRTGALFETRYKAIDLDLPRDILYLSYYIHKQQVAEDLKMGIKPKKIKAYSSLPYYLGQKHASWVKPERVLQQLKKVLPPFSSYQKFLDSQVPDLLKVLGTKTME